MSFQHLTSPFRLGTRELPNRVILTPLTRGRANSDGLPTDIMETYYAQRSGAGFIVSEGTVVSEQGSGWFQAPGLYTEAHAQAWTNIISAVHNRGGVIFCQLWHTGGASHSSFREGNPCFPGELALGVAPSALKKKSQSGLQMYTMQPGAVAIETPRALQTQEVADVVEQFRNSARLAKIAGFDGVEIHAAAGYLIDEFLQTCSNKRTDQYGGCVENRFRLMGEIISAVRTEFPLNEIGVRLSPNGAYNGMGSEDNRDSFLYYARRLEEIGVVYLHIVIGTTFEPNPFHGIGEPMTLADFRKVYNGVIIGNAGYDGDSADREIASGSCDAISFGRLYISNPDLAERLQAGVPLNDMPPFDVFFSAAERVLGAEGYIDFPCYK